MNHIPKTNSIPVMYTLQSRKKAIKTKIKATKRYPSATPQRLPWTSPRDHVPAQERPRELANDVNEVWFFSLGALNAQLPQPQNADLHNRINNSNNQNTVISI